MKPTSFQLQALRRVLNRAEEDNAVFAEGQDDPKAIAECEAQQADIEVCRKFLQEQEEVLQAHEWKTHFFSEIRGLALSPKDCFEYFSVAKQTLEQWREGKRLPDAEARKRISKTLLEIEKERYEAVLARMNMLGTRRVLQLLRSTYSPSWYNNQEGREQSRTYEAAKAVLATREHIPNKKEAKAIRQEAARKSKGQGKGKNR